MTIRKASYSDDLNIITKKKKNKDISPEVQDFLFEKGVLSIGEKLGEGSFGDVYVAQIKENSPLIPEGKKINKVAIKILNKRALQNEKMTEFSRDRIPGEVLPLKIDVEDSHLIKVFSVVTEDFFEELSIQNKDNLKNAKGESLRAVVMEYIENCSSVDMNELEDNQVVSVVEGTLKGLSILHKNNIVHRDIKPANLLFDNGDVKVLDFGLAKELKKGSLKNSGVGTPGYYSPETIEKHTLNEKADIWSVGVLAYEGLFGCQPFRLRIGAPVKQVDKTILNYKKNYSSFTEFHKKNHNIEDEENIDPKWWDFFNLCFAPDPQKRPNADTLLKSPVFIK